jgi:hypothetical protein
LVFGGGAKLVQAANVNGLKAKDITLHEGVGVFDVNAEGEIAILPSSMRYNANTANFIIKMNKDGILSVIAGNGINEEEHSSDHAEIEATSASVYGTQMLRFGNNGEIYLGMGQRLKSLVPKTENGVTKYMMSTLFGGATNAKDCGTGQMKSKANSNLVSDLIKVGLSNICPGDRIYDIAFHDNCNAVDSADRIMKYAFISGDLLIEVAKGCHE